MTKDGGTKGINSDSSTWYKDIRITLRHMGMQGRDGFLRQGFVSTNMGDLQMKMLTLAEAKKA